MMIEFHGNSNGSDLITQAQAEMIKFLFNELGYWNYTGNVLKGVQNLLIKRVTEQW